MYTKSVDAVKHKLMDCGDCFMRTAHIDSAIYLKGMFKLDKQLMFGVKIFWLV
jgi:hypothetical protein